jgi:hypothetical protein
VTRPGRAAIGQRRLLDVESLAGHPLPPGSVFAFLAGALVAADTSIGDGPVEVLGDSAYGTGTMLAGGFGRGPVDPRHRQLPGRVLGLPDARPVHDS